MKIGLGDRLVAAHARSLLRAGFVGASCGALICGSAAMAQETNGGSANAKPEKVTQTADAKAKAEAKAKAKKSGSVGPVAKAPAAAAPQIPACSMQSAYALNEKVGLKGWAIYAPNMGDTITNDVGCWRTKLAEQGIGVIWQTGSQFASNMLTHYVPSGNAQQYVGQRPAGGESSILYLTYDMSRWGLTDGQFEIAAVRNDHTYSPIFSQEASSVAELKYYGTAFNKALEYEFGYLQTYLRFQGFFIGGNINNPFGPAAGSAAQVGQALTPEAAPAFIAKWNITDNWYDRFGIQRSMPGTVQGSGIWGVTPNATLGNMYAVENLTNPTGLNFTNSSPCVYGVCYHSPRELFIDEIGYQAKPLPGQLGTWVRLTGYYNTTDYADLSSTTGATTKNYAVSLYADQQIWQAEPGSPLTAYKGVYVGGTVAYDDPKADAISQDYQFRIYSIGLFGRPRDQLAFSYERQVTSKYVTQLTNSGLGCLSGFVCAQDHANSYTLTYTANILPGIYATLGAQYVDHASIVWSPLATQGISTIPTLAGPLNIAPLNIKDSFNFLASMFIAL
jgi:porin